MQYKNMTYILLILVTKLSFLRTKERTVDTRNSYTMKKSEQPWNQQYKSKTCKAFSMLTTVALH